MLLFIAYLVTTTVLSILWVRDKLKVKVKPTKLEKEFSCPHCGNYEVDYFTVNEKLIKQ